MALTNTGGISGSASERLSIELAGQDTVIIASTASTLRPSHHLIYEFSVI